MKFFRLSHNDLDELADLEGRCFTLRWSREQFAKAFELPHFAAFGLRAPPGKQHGTEGNAPLAAYISLYQTPDELEILNLAVTPELRGRGCATRLLRLTLHMAAEIGIGRAVLEVRSGNMPALALYKGLGFTQVGRRCGYYRDNEEDALVLALPLRKI